MKGFKSILNEFWSGTIEEVKKPSAKIVRNQFTKERPDKVTFERLMQMHDLTPQVQIAVSSYGELITGTEMQIATKSKDAQEFLEEWARRTNFYDKFEGVVATTLICGNALLEKLSGNDIEDVEEVDMTTIIDKKRDDVGKLEWYDQRQQSGNIVKLKNTGDFIEFNLTNYSKQAWGRSLFYSLAVPRTTGFRTSPPLIEILWGVEDAIGGMLLNNAYPITTITYPGANDEYLEKEAERWRRYKPGDKRVQKIKPEIEFFETQQGSKYTDYITHIEKTIELGTQFPHDIMTGDFTSRASSETTETIVMKKVRGYQRYLSNKLKTELFDIILEQNGYNPEEEELEISFTTQNIIELEPEKVLKLFTDNVITLEEVRDWFATNTGMELTKQQMKQLIADKELNQQLQQQDQQFKKKMDSTKESFKAVLSEKEKKIEELKEKLMLREQSEKKYERAKILKEITEDIKKL